MSMANLIANFGARQGQNVERRIGNAMAYKGQQNAMAKQEDAQAKAAQMDFMKQGISAIASMPQEQRGQAWEGLRQGAAANFGQDHPLAVNMPQYSDEIMSQSMARFGVKSTKPDDGGFTLGKGQRRYDANNNLIAGGGNQEHDPQFEGTGLEAQMLNAINNPNLPENHPMKIAARQYLGKGKTMVTPDGTYNIPGYDVAGLTGQQQPDGNGVPNFTPKQATAGQSSAANFLNMMRSAQVKLSKLPESFNPASFSEVAGSKTNITSSPEYQLYRNGARAWIRAKLRKESGAAIGKDEMAQEFEVFFPQFGDGQEVIQQKAEFRRIAEESLAAEAGAAALPKPSPNDRPANLNSSQEQKSLNGKLYTKINGAWYEQ